ncbi:methionine ABC transporter ATP-binding protein [Asticcacaulis sp. AND118]|uniref:methionine ABC transporter ATP-binding protein n=1 Tax=Asticcacaulis sp. AND118 TaxID=2840468 RepID=UPI001CFF8409|nr:ATP-binding cassette domain-containing protein [Asticcacaulis sp. AND118]UDF05635.1 ATP-binding cassette domain-containing protein [Asticcacaulis sp. AND118]
MIALRGVTKRFTSKGGVQAALDGVDLDIARGEVFGIIGPSGSGKSTLIRLLNRLETPSEGRVVVNGVDLAGLDARALSALRHKMGMIFQAFGLLSSKTALQNVAYALELAGTGTAETRRQRALDLLDRVGLSAHAQKYPAQLSGGQKQRVAIARALANAPDILLCDEATSALDPEATQGILALLGELNSELGLTIVLVTHEMDVVRQVCDRVAVLDHGQLAEAGAVEQVLFAPVSAAGRALSKHILPPPPEGVGKSAVTLTYFGEVVYSDALSASVQGLEARFSVLSGQVSSLKSGPYGHMIVDMSGADRTEALNRLRARGVTVTESAQ